MGDVIPFPEFTCCPCGWQCPRTIVIRVPNIDRASPNLEQEFADARIEYECPNCGRGIRCPIVDFIDYAKDPDAPSS